MKQKEYFDLFMNGCHIFWFLSQTKLFKMICLELICFLSPNQADQDMRFSFVFMFRRQCCRSNFHLNYTDMAGWLWELPNFWFPFLSLTVQAHLPQIRGCPDHVDSSSKLECVGYIFLKFFTGHDSSLWQTPLIVTKCPQLRSWPHTALLTAWKKI